jgi:hypothetical protein
MALALLANCATAAEAELQVVSVRLGLGGKYAVGLWTPVVIELRAGAQPLAGRLSIAMTDGDEATCRVTAPQNLALAPGQTDRVWMYGRFGSLENELAITFSPDQGEPITRHYSSQAVRDNIKLTPAAPSHRALVVNVGPDVGLQALADFVELDGPKSIEHARVTNVAELPPKWFGYEGLHTLVLATSQAETYDALAGDPARLEALDQWVKLGGRLVIFAGQASAGRVVAAGRPLARFLPGEFTHQSVTLRRLSDIEAYTGTSLPLPEPEQNVVVPLISQPRGTVEVQHGNAPLVIRAPHGFGQVVFAAIDFDQPPFAQWTARGQFLSKLLGEPQANAPPQRKSEAGGRLSHSGLTDLSGQLRGALDQFSGVQLVPFVTVSLLVCAYLALIGPADYFLLKKLVRRMELTWLTFPTVVVISCLAAWKTAYWLKGSELRHNQADLIDVDLESGLVRGFSWVNVFSPQVAAYDVSFQPQLPHGPAPMQSELLTAWWGLPGPSLGGMDQPGAPLRVSPAGYQISPALDRLEQTPIQVWSSKSFVGRWSAQAQVPFAAEVKAGVDGLPEGRLTNTLDVPLRNCLLAYARWAVTIPELKPGETVTIDYHTQRRELQDELTGRRLEYDTAAKEYRNVVRRYDELSFDVPSILQQMMFFRASGGAEYAGLGNQHQQIVDLSHQLQLGRAIFIAFVERPGAELLLNGRAVPVHPHDQHWTCYRFVFRPLAQKSSAP